MPYEKRILDVIKSGGSGAEKKVRVGSVGYVTITVKGLTCSSFDSYHDMRTLFPFSQALSHFPLLPAVPRIKPPLSPSHPPLPSSHPSPSSSPGV